MARSIRQLVELAKSDPASLSVSELAQLERYRRMQEKQGTRRTPDPDWRVSNRRLVAAFFGRSLAAINVWAREGMPGRTGAYDLSAIARWRLSRQAPAASLTEERKAKLELIRERREKLRLERLITSGKLHDTEQCRQRRLRQIHALKAGLLELPRSLAPHLAHKPAPEIAAMLAARVDQLLSAYAAGWDGQGPPPGAEASTRAPKRSRSKTRAKKKRAKPRRPS